MPTPYEKLYENLLPKFRSYEIPFMTEDEVKSELHDYLIPAAARFHVCKKDLTDRDDESECFRCELSDNEIEILSNYMLIEYIDSTYVRTPTLLKVNLSSSDFNAFSPANMLDKLLSMQKRYISENEGLLSRYAWLDGIKNNGNAFKKLKQSAGRKKNTG